jgi:hypothetical protein
MLSSAVAPRSRLLALAGCLLIAGPAHLAGQSCQAGSPPAARPIPASAADDAARSVLTQHNDNARTGAYLQEQQLNAVTVCPARFGKLFTRRVEGQIYAQPLYVANLPMADGARRNVVYVATMHNMVYAFDADDPSAAGDHPLWLASLGNSVPYNFMPMPGSFLGKYNVRPEYGITGTPVIDLASQTMYLAAKTCERPLASDCANANGANTAYRLHALDIVTGAERPNSPKLIEAICNDTTPGQPARRFSFNAAHHLQRAGLLLSRGLVYLGFGSHADAKHFHGWILAYDPVTLEQVSSFCTSPHVDGAAVWQAGSGLVADDAGDIFAMTGNGLKGQPPGRRDLTNSVVRLTRELRLIERFVPANESCLSELDVDLGSAGPILLNPWHLLLGGGKEGVFYLLNAGYMGGRQSPQSLSHRDRAPCARAGNNPASPPLQSFQGARQWELTVMSSILPVFGYHHVHGAPVFYDNPYNGPEIFVMPERDYLRAFRFDATTQRFPDAQPPGNAPRDSYHSRQTNSPHGMPGGILALSADAREHQADWPKGQPSTGIVWAAMPLEKDAFTDVVPGILRAYRANDLTELWNSQQRPGDEVGNFAKYTPPTVANGKVYLATFSNRLDVYGLR